jgi:acyl-CoA thioester hydrolase
MDFEEDGWHECRVRTRYGEVDRMGVVYHPNYLVYFEQGRTEYLRSLGATYRQLEDEGTLLVVTEVGVRFHRPAGYDEELRILTRLASARGVRLRFEYEVRRDAERLATGFTVLASADARGRPQRPPPALRALLDDRKSATAADVQGGPEPGPAGERR